MKVYKYSLQDLDIINLFDSTNKSFWTEKNEELKLLRENLRKHFLNEQKNRCSYCKLLKQENHGLTWDIEHIVPRKLFPHFTFEPLNLSISCKECNEAKGEENVFTTNYKYKKYPKSEKYAIIHPHFDKYTDHMDIRIMPDGKILHVPKSSKGKNTFYICDLVRFTMEAFNSQSIDRDLLISFSRFVDNSPTITPDIAKAFFVAALPQLLPSEFVDC